MLNVAVDESTPVWNTGYLPQSDARRSLKEEKPVSIEEQNVALANKFAETFSSGDVDAIVNALAPNAEYWVSGTIDGMSGSYTPQELGKLLGGVTTIYKGGALKITPIATTAQGNRVAVEAEGYAELNDGRIYNPKYHFLFEIEGGEIIRVREYLDTKHAFDIFYS